ncbi:hypothetical protein K466DRAFT_38007 [Polyporus arcularius HHB13444]|uniref:Uncharacterized protein n=1 Tax=Polyporus arcularius HHB13444 TaxID=1314778 RepID=A0A5C3NP84_9APHY|nr:hypothetical protein K466DRAFT_38007 [Polyporus arcularius HHB13444]
MTTTWEAIRGREASERKNAIDADTVRSLRRSLPGLVPFARTATTRASFGTRARKTPSSRFDRSLDVDRVHSSAPFDAARHPLCRVSVRRRCPSSTPRLIHPSTCTLSTTPNAHTTAYSYATLTSPSAPPFKRWRLVCAPFDARSPCESEDVHATDREDGSRIHAASPYALLTALAGPRRTSLRAAVSRRPEQLEPASRQWRPHTLPAQRIRLEHVKHRTCLPCRTGRAGPQPSRALWHTGSPAPSRLVRHRTSVQDRRDRPRTGARSPAADCTPDAETRDARPTRRLRRSRRRSTEAAGSVQTRCPDDSTAILSHTASPRPSSSSATCHNSHDRRQFTATAGPRPAAQTPAYLLPSRARESNSRGVLRARFYTAPPVPTRTAAPRTRTPARRVGTRLRLADLTSHAGGPHSRIRPSHGAVGLTKTPQSLTDDYRVRGCEG